MVEYKKNMEPNTIQKLLNYYYTRPEFKEEILRAIRKFFNKPKLSVGDTLELSDESDEDAFNEWLVFDFHLKNKKTLLQDYYDTNPYNLPLYQMQIYQDLQRSIYSIFEVADIMLGYGMRLHDLRNDKEYIVQEVSGTYQTKKGALIFARVGKVGDRLELVGGNCKQLQGEAKGPQLGFFFHYRKLNPKIIRDFFQQVEKMKDTEEEYLKEKILGNNACICDICHKKGKFAASSYDKKTLRPMVICYQCNLEILAQRQGITKKEADKRRKRMFEVGYIFQEMKAGEYLKLKNKKIFDSIEEINQVLQKIIKVWNNLTIKQRKGFEKMDDEKLHMIYKDIQVYF